jgi:hypothetical protein
MLLARNRTPGDESTGCRHTVNLDWFRVPITLHQRCADDYRLKGEGIRPGRLFQALACYPLPGMKATERRLGAQFGVKGCVAS